MFTAWLPRTTPPDVFGLIPVDFGGRYRRRFRNGVGLENVYNVPPKLLLHELQLLCLLLVLHLDLHARVFAMRDPLLDCLWESFVLTLTHNYSYN